MADLTGRKIANSYKDLLQVNAETSNEGLSGTLRRVQDGEGKNSAISLSQNEARIHGDLGITGNLSVGSFGVDSLEASIVSATDIVAGSTLVVNGSAVATSSGLVTVSATAETRIAGVSSTLAATSATLKSDINAVSANLVSTSATLESHISTVSVTLSTINVDLQTSIANHLPLAGGNMTGAITLDSDVTVALGDDEGLNIYYKGTGVSGGYIENKTGQLFLKTDTFGYLRDANNNSQLAWSTNGLSLYHDNFVVANTSSTGLHVANTVSATNIVATSVNSTNIYVNGVTVADSSAVASVNTIALAAASATTSANLETRIATASSTLATSIANVSSTLETRIANVSSTLETRIATASSTLATSIANVSSTLQTQITTNADAITSINTVVNDVNASAIAAVALSVAVANTSIAANASSIGVNLAAINSVNNVASAAMPRAGGTFTGGITLESDVTATFGDSSQIKVYATSSGGSDRSFMKLKGDVLNISTSAGAGDTAIYIGAYVTADKAGIQNLYAGTVSGTNMEFARGSITSANIPNLHTSIVSAQAYYGDGSNLTGIITGASVGTSASLETRINDVSVLTAGVSSTMATSVANAAAAAVAFAIALG